LAVGGGPEGLDEVKRTAAWNAAVDQVKQLGVGDVNADRCLSQAFGWGTQKYWRNEKLNETPDPAVVEENLNYLRSVGFSDEDLSQITEKFPEFLACDCATRLRPNIEYLQKSFFLKGTHRVKAIMRKPRVIGNIIDCEGDCKGECTRCWSQF